MRFYTLPPTQIEHPYYLVNIHNWKVLRHRRFDHAILDPGVEMFLDNPELTEYPEGAIDKFIYRAKNMTSIYGDRFWATLPDYMDDYNPGQFGNNVEKTLANIERLLPIDGVNWLPVIQARYLDILGFYESCYRTRKLVGDYPHLAIGTVCKTHNLRFIEECCKIARSQFPKSHLHAFGLTLRGLDRAKRIDSFDSMAWTFPRGRGRGTAKNVVEKREFFHAYMMKVKEACSA